MVFVLIDDKLINNAKQLGYIAGFTLERRPAERFDNLMALPRYLMINQVQGAFFEKILEAPSHSHPNMKNKP